MSARRSCRAWSIAARARSRICPVELSAAPASGVTEITAGEKSIGTLLTAEGTNGLAIMRLDRLADAVAQGEELLTGAVRVHVRKPPWAGFDVAGA